MLKCAIQVLALSYSFINNIVIQFMSFQIKAYPKISYINEDFLLVNQSKNVSTPKSFKEISFGAAQFKPSNQTIYYQKSHSHGEQQPVMKPNRSQFHQMLELVSKNLPQNNQKSKYSDFLQKYKDRLKRERKKQLKQHDIYSNYKKNMQLLSDTKIMEILNQKINIRQRPNKLPIFKDYDIEMQDPKLTISCEKTYKVIKQLKETKIVSAESQELSLPTLKLKSNRKPMQAFVFTNRDFNKIASQSKFPESMTPRSKSNNKRINNEQVEFQRIQPWSSNHYQQDDNIISSFI